MNDTNPLNSDNFPPKLVVDTKPQPAPQAAAPAVNPVVQSEPSVPKLETVVQEKPETPVMSSTNQTAPSFSQPQPLQVNPTTQVAPQPVTPPTASFTPTASPQPGEADIVGSGFKAAGFRSALNEEPSSPAGPVPSAAAPEATQVFGQQEKKSKGKGKSINAKNAVIAGVLVITLASLVAGFGKIRTFLTNAQGGCEPENISEANLTANSIEIVFQTSKACQVEVAYGTNKDALLLQVPESMPSLNHRIRLAPLLASTTYYYQIVSEGKKLGTVRSFLTKAPVPSAMPTLVPTKLPLAPTSIPATSSAYTLDDFQKYFGTENAEFDIDKNGAVNMRDWLLYQKSSSPTPGTSSESAEGVTP